MAHAMKMTKGACGHMFKHYERAKDKDGNYIKFANENIDLTRTHLNYNLAPDHDGMSQGEYVKQRCNEVYCLKRKDVNVCVDWCITAPKDLPEEETDEFFKKSYEFLENRYGSKNVVSAYVHMDEVTPHMHFCFVPVVWDEKKCRLKVSAKECISKTELKQFHPALEKHLFKNLIFCSILNDATKEGNRSIAELKRQSATERLQKVSTETRKMLADAEKQVETMKSTIKALKVEYGARKAFLEEMDKLSKVTNMYPDFAERSSRGIINKKEYVTVPVENWEALHVSADEKYYLKAAYEKLDSSVRDLQQSISYQNLENLKKQVADLKAENQELKRNRKKLLGDISRLEKIEKYIPEELLKNIRLQIKRENQIPGKSR